MKHHMGPPRLAESLLRRLLPRGMRGHSILGDLREEYRSLRLERGTLVARVWYWANALLLSLQYPRPMEEDRPNRRRSLSPQHRRGAGIVESLLHDLRYAIRNLLKRPGFTAVVVATFAIGIGGTVAVFAALNAVFLRPLPYEDPDRLLFANGWNSYGTGTWVSAFDYFDYREQVDAFESLAAISGMGLTVTVVGDDAAERITERLVSTELFSTLGVTPALGRDFVPAEEEAGSERVVMLSDGFWRRNYGSDPAALGSTLVIGEQPHTVIGVMPRDFDFPEGADIWRPLRRDSPWASSRGPQNWAAVGRLRHGVSLDQAQQQVNVIGARLEEAYPATNQGRGWQLTGLHDQLVRQARPMVPLLAGAVGLVLLIACANVAGLLLARGVTRSGELAVRSALGASRSRLMRELLAESVLLALAGGVLGLLLAVWLLDVVKYFAPPGMPGIHDMQLDRAALVFAMIASTLTGLLVGLAPALRSVRADVARQVSPARSGSGSRSSSRLRGALVVGQVALSLVLLVGAGLLMRSFLQLQKVNPGFDESSLLTAEVTLPSDGYTSSGEVNQFFGSLVEDLEGRPDVVAVAAISRLPIATAGGDFPVYPEESPPDDPSQRGSAIVRSVTTGYFEAMRIPILAGRGLNELDDQNAPAVAVVDESLVRRYYPDDNPLGKNLMLGFQNPFAVQIVGVAGEVQSSRLAGEPNPHMYFSMAQWPQRGMYVVVRTAADPMSSTGILRDAARTLDANVPVAKVASMSDILANSIALPRSTMLFLGAYAGVALMLAVLGLYGVLSHFVSQRSHEIGVRIALGAARGNVLQLVLNRGLALVALGVGLGVAGAVGVTRFLQTLLFEVGATDLVTFVSVSLLLVAVAAAACVFPAWRATRVDAVTTLRTEQ